MDASPRILHDLSHSLEIDVAALEALLGGLSEDGTTLPLRDLVQSATSSLEAWVETDLATLRPRRAYSRESQTVTFTTGLTREQFEEHEYTFTW